MKYYKECEQDKRPRILALTYPLFAPPKKDAETKDEAKTEKLPQIDEEKEIDDQNKDIDVSVRDKTLETNEKDTERPSVTETTEEVSVTEETQERNEKDTEKLTETEKTQEDVIIDSNTDTAKDVNEEIKTDVKKVSDSEEMGVYENLDDFQMYEKLEWKIEELEKGLCCQMDLAEDIDGGKR